MIVGRRSPDLCQSVLRHPSARCATPSRTDYDCACIGATVEDRADDFGLARACITMLTEVGVKAQRAVLLSFEQAFPLQKMNRENCGVTTVAAANRQGAISKIGKRSDRTPGWGDDFGRSAYIGVTHGCRPAAMVAPCIGL